MIGTENGGRSTASAFSPWLLSTPALGNPRSIHMLLIMDLLLKADRLLKKIPKPQFFLPFALELVSKMVRWQPEGKKEGSGAGEVRQTKGDLAI